MSKSSFSNLGSCSAEFIGWQKYLMGTSVSARVGGLGSGSVCSRTVAPWARTEAGILGFCLRILGPWLALESEGYPPLLYLCL